MELCDRVTVLRKGRNMGTLTREEMTIDKLTELMFSRKIMIRRYNNRSMQGKVILSLKNVSTFSNGGYIGLKDISLDIRVGEIVGIVGVAGNGQNELAQVAVGLIKPHSGRIIIDGDDLTGKSIFEFYKKGLAYIPDNILDGLVLDMTLTENAILKLYRTSGFSMNHIVDWETAKRYTSEIVKNLEIKTPSIDVKIKSLSGGNLQRFILSRELSNNPKIIIAVHPSRGLDLESTAKVLGYLAKMKSHSGILLITEDLDEAIKICDKIMIIYKGKLSKPMNIDNLDYELAGKMMSGAVSIEEAN
jgi:simple sugar transport system ATP-binding protein